MSAKKRGRAERRLQERGARKLARDRHELAKLAPGGAPERPLEVTTSAVIEGRAQSTPCPLCEGVLRVEQHRAETVGGQSVRAVDMICLQCAIGRTLWFRIVAPLPN